MENSFYFPNDTHIYNIHVTNLPISLIALREPKKILPSSDVLYGKVLHCCWVCILMANISVKAIIKVPVSRYWHWEDIWISQKGHTHVNLLSEWFKRKEQLYWHFVCLCFFYHLYTLFISLMEMHWPIQSKGNFFQAAIIYLWLYTSYIAEASGDNRLLTYDNDLPVIRLSWHNSAYCLATTGPSCAEGRQMHCNVFIESGNIWHRVAFANSVQITTTRHLSH